MGEASRGLDELAETGTQARLLDRMQHRADLYDLIDYEGYSAFDGDVFDFTVER
jgi:methylisocitrate lyase